MDGYKRPFRGSKIYTRKKADEDDTLVNLYKDSEFAQENDDASDIDAFINDSDDIDETDIPIKKSAQKAHRKQRKKAQRRESIKRTSSKIIATVIVAGIFIGLCLWFFWPTFSENDLDAPQQEAAIADEVYYSPLTGLESNNKKIATAEATCIMVENSTDARPQSGLNSAGVVYEAVAEGGITRFMAIFQDDLPAWIGPLRSARLTFVELARPYNCGYVHIGGAANAINTLHSAGYRDLDGGWVEGQYVFRVNDRWAPHNVYTDAEHLNIWSSNKGYTSSKFNGFSRIEPDTIIEPEKRNATTITVIMSGDDSYNARWAYSPETNQYARSHISGGAHKTVTKNGKESQITTDVVIAMKMTTKTRTSQPKFYDHNTTGSGEAFIFQNGVVQKATWRRANITDELGFYDIDGKAIELNRGRTWISIYNNVVSGHVSWK